MLRQIGKNILDIFKKRYAEILLILILLIICVVSVKWDSHILSNDNYSPELNPTLSVSRYLISPAWRGYRVLGFASESEQADVFRSGIFSIFNTFTPSWLIGQLFYFFSMAIGSIAIASLVRSLIQKSKLKRYSNWAYLLSGIIYFTTLWTMWLFYQNMAPYIVSFGFLPLVILAVYRYAVKSNWKNLSFLFLSSILFSTTSVIATLFIISFAFLICFTVFINLILKKGARGRIKGILITLGIFLITQIFWILPFIHYTLSTSSDIINSYTNRSITSSIIDLETDSQTLINSARLYNRTLFDMDGDSHLFPMAELFQTYDFYKVIGLIPAILSLIALIFGIFKKNYTLLFWGALGVVSLFLIKVLNPPFAEVFMWLQKEIPLFKQVLRWPFSKLGQIYLICITVLATFGAVYLIKFFSSFIDKRISKRFVIISSFVFLCILQLIYAEYMFRGDIFADRAVVNVPKEYFELGQYLEQNDGNGRIYYAPPSNNNYFREYEWGFWGSQFISYIIPNPVMDISLAVGSRVGENAMLDILNTVRSNNKEGFLSLMQKYNVSYVLFDTSIKQQGYAFDLDEEKVRELFSDYELIWSSGELSLFKVPDRENVTYTESLSDISLSNVFVRDVSKFPVLSSIDIDLENLRIDNNEIVGDFKYRGYSTYMYSNLTRELLNSMPTKVVYSNGDISVYPSYPYVQGDSSVKPFRIYTGKYDYYLLGNTVLNRSDVSKGVTVESSFGDTTPVYAVSNSEFKSIDMIPYLLQKKGSDCSGGSIIESTFVTPQETSSGFKIKGTTQSPCIYTEIPLNTSVKNILRIKLNWEAENDNYPGYCIYSESKKRCLNTEKYFSTDVLFGDVDLLLNSVIEEGERISLILYATNMIKDTPSEITFRTVKIEYAPLNTQLSPILISDTWKSEEVFLDNENIYTIHIPIINGSTGYSYIGINSSDTIWQPNRSDSESKIFKVSIKDGQYQKVVNDYINQTANLFNTKPNTRYLVYWRGENISNIPSSLCLIYDKEQKCWFQDMLRDSQMSSYLNILNSGNEDRLLNVIYGSSSYKLTTENILNEFVFMQYPTSWSNLKYIQDKQDTFIEYEMANIFNSSESTYYKISKEDIKGSQQNILISIPQAKSSGWVAIKKNGIFLSVLDKDTRVSINGWKQAWDISDEDFDSVSVIYWPNLLSYFGYILILITGTYLTIKLIEEKRNGKK